jgi:hypothetical protein
MTQAPDPTPRSNSGAEPTRPRGSGCADVITASFAILTVVVIAYTVLLYTNPQSILNPFPPPIPPTQIVLATDAPTNTPTHTWTPLPASPTPIASITPSYTPTVPTLTFTPSYTPVIAVRATSAPTTAKGGTTAPRATSSHPNYTASPYAFTVDPIRFIANTSSDTCNYQSIVVLALDLDNKPAKGVVAHITQTPNMDEFDPLNQHTTAGDNSLEVSLGATPRQDQYTVQLVSRTGTPISDAVIVPTKATCDQNISVVTFIQNHTY